MSLGPAIRIGTRGSPLALAQAEQVRAGLAALEPKLAAPDAVEIVPIVTSGDRFQERPLSEIGNKGLFVKEIEQALENRRIDVAVHSMKDVETWIDPRFVIAALLPREDPRDTFVSLRAADIGSMPEAGVLGTTSLRRRSMALAVRPDLRVVTFRGNVQTRLRKLREGEADGTILALCGLKRLGMLDVVTTVLEPEEMMPAAAQGAIGVECRADDTATRELLGRLDHRDTATVIAAERGLLAALDGSCRTPIGALAETEADGKLRLRAVLGRADGSRVWRVERRGPSEDAVAIGVEAGRVLREAGDRELFQ